MMPGPTHPRSASAEARSSSKTPVPRQLNPFAQQMPVDQVYFGASANNLPTDEDSVVAYSFLQRVIHALVEPDTSDDQPITEQEGREIQSMVGLIPRGVDTGEALLAKMFEGHEPYLEQHFDEWRPPVESLTNVRITALLEGVLSTALEREHGILIAFSTMLLKVGQGLGLFAPGQLKVDDLFQNIKRSIAPTGDQLNPSKVNGIVQRSLVAYVKQVLDPSFQHAQQIAPEDVATFTRMLALIPDAGYKNTLREQNDQLMAMVDDAELATLEPHPDVPINTLSPAQRTECLEHILNASKATKNPFLDMAAFFLLHITQKADMLPAGTIKNLDNPFQ